MRFADFHICSEFTLDVNMADGSGAGSPQAGGPQSEIIMLMSQMRDAITVSAQCAQSSTSALEALRAERVGKGALEARKVSGKQ